MRGKIRFEFRRRTRASDDYMELHRRLLNHLRKAGDPWWNPKTSISNPDMREGLETQVNLGPGLPRNVTGYVSYVFRDPSYSLDTAEFDDRLILDASVEQPDYELMAVHLFPILVEGFRPYRAGVVIDEELALDDWDRAIEIFQASGRDADGRDGVIRIPPVCFFDNELCRRAFRLRPEALARRLQGSTREAKVIDGGILIIASLELLGKDNLVALDDHLRAAIINSDRLDNKGDPERV